MVSRGIIRVLAVLLALLPPPAAQPVLAQAFSGLARIDMAGSHIEDRDGAVSIVLSLSQGVPFRVFTLDAPERLVMDFREIDWSGVSPAALNRSVAVKAVRVGQFLPGWSRIVVDLAGPYALDHADMRVDAPTGRAVLDVSLGAVSAESFAAQAGAPEGASWTGKDAAPIAAPGGDRFVVVLDPGHGGIDPGAEEGGAREKDLMLTFALELREALLRSGDVEVILTRRDDRFVSLERRVAIAHQSGADVFLSLHADSLSEGNARGATVYTLSANASDKASAALAERHDRDDILSGIDLEGQDDVVADILMDLARQETEPRTARLAEALRLGIKQRQIRLNTRAKRSAGFSVLKSPDIPSILLELGFLSHDKDRANIEDPEWRGNMAAGIRDAILAWRQADAAGSGLVRQ